MTANHHRQLHPCVDLGKDPETSINPNLSTWALPYEQPPLERL